MVCLQVFIHYNFVRTSLLKSSCFMGLSDMSQEPKRKNGASKCNRQLKLAEVIKGEKGNHPSWNFTISWKLSPHLLKFWKIIQISQEFYFICLFLEKLISTKVVLRCHPGIIIINIIFNFDQINISIHTYMYV